MKLLEDAVGTRGDFSVPEEESFVVLRSFVPEVAAAAAFLRFRQLKIFL